MFGLKVKKFKLWPHTKPHTKKNINITQIFVTVDLQQILNHRFHTIELSEIDFLK